MQTPTTTFLLIRHAESEANAGGYYGGQSDSPLSARGREQARQLADALAQSTVHAVYSSDLSRARETVAPIAALRALPLRETPLLRERHMGAFTGRSFDEVRAAYPELFARIVARDPEAAPPGGESPRDLMERAARFVRALVAEHRGQTVVLGSHGVFIQHLVRELLGIRDLRVPLWIASSNAGLTRVDLFESAPSIMGARLTYANRVLPFGAEPLLP